MEFRIGEQLIRAFQFDSDPEKMASSPPVWLFDASAEAMDLVYWTKGLEVIEFAQLKESYWFAQFGTKVMSGDEFPM